MPVYTCNTVRGTLAGTTKNALAAEIAEIHSAVNHVPVGYVNVLFAEFPPEDVFTGGRPGSPVIVTGWARRGHPQDDITELAVRISAAVARIAAVDESLVLVVIEDSPARSAVEGGRVTPEPGQEASWLAPSTG